MLNHERVVAQIRVTMTLIVGTLAAWAANLGVDIDTTGWAQAFSVVVIAAYYALIRWAAERWPALGWLFAVNRRPQYEGASRDGT